MKNGLPLQKTASTGQSVMLFVKNVEEKTENWTNQASDLAVKGLGSYLGTKLISSFLKTSNNLAIFKLILEFSGEQIGSKTFQKFDKNLGNPVKNTVSYLGKFIIRPFAALVTLVNPSYFFKMTIVEGISNKIVGLQPPALWNTQKTDYLKQLEKTPEKILPKDFIYDPNKLLTAKSAGLSGQSAEPKKPQIEIISPKL